MGVRAGDELVNPATGLRTVFRETSKDTGGELLQVDWIGAKGWSTGPDHVHRSQEERFEVLCGRLGLRLDGEETMLEPGEVAVAPPGAPHAAWNAGAEDVHVLVDFRPALRTELVFEALAGLAGDGRTFGPGIPRNPFRLALILHGFEEEFQFVLPPRIVQRALLAPVAKVVEVLGYEAEYPYAKGAPR